MIRFCIILGAAKCGTSSLFNYLSQHPEIAGCSNKEPNYFSLKYKLGADWYFDLWNKDDVGTKILLESTVNYTNQPATPDCSTKMLEFSKKHNASMKFIYIMRDPIIRLKSHYTYNYIHRTSWSLETALDKGYLVSASSYAKQLDSYFEKFTHQDFLLLDFDQLKHHPEVLLVEICKFLKIDPTYTFKGTKTVYNKTEGQIVTRPWENLNRKYPFVQQYANFFPKSFRQFIFHSLFRKKIKDHFNLTKSQRQRVYNELKDDMARLHQKYGVNVSKWGF